MRKASIDGSAGLAATTRSRVPLPLPFRFPCVQQVDGAHSGPQVGVVGGQAVEAERAEPQRGAQGRVAVVGQDRQAAEPGAVDMARAGALDEEVEHGGHRERGELEAGAPIAEHARDIRMNVGYPSGNQRGDKRTLQRGADHLPIHDAVVRGRLPGRSLVLLPPRHCRRAALVFGWLARGHVVGARKVVIRKRGEVEDVVVAVLRAATARRLVERVADEEVGAGEDEMRRLLRKLGVATDRAVMLGRGFVPPVGGHVEIVTEIAQPSWMGGELP